jgi:phage terminase small subunit
MSPCSLHHDRFAAEYLIDTNAAQAAMRAGYSPGTAKHQGARLLAMPGIRTRISERRQGAAHRANIAVPGPATRRRWSPTARQSRFVREYLRDYNGKQAAIRSGYSTRSAEVTASRLLRHPVVGAEIRRLHDARTYACQIDQDLVLAELGKIAFLDVSTFWRRDGRWKSPDEWSPDQRACVRSYRLRMRRDADGAACSEVRSVTFWNKVTALTLLARHFAIV